MQVTKNALEIMKSRILHDGETPADMVKRVAGVVSLGDEADEARFIEVMENKWFLPNSPCLVNAGTRIGQLSACFVLPIEDSMESIMQTLYNAAIIQKTGGGVGFNFSALRPEGAKVKSTNGEASGPVSFMRMFNATMEEIRQGGRRRGASLAVLNADHVDILQFIRCKQEDGRLNNFNISVGVTFDFMKQVMDDKEARFPEHEIWDAIVESAHRNGEPGLIFLDTINDSNPTPELGRIEALNPCSESTLLSYESCVLGSINLSEMVVNGKVDETLLARVVRIAVDFLDNVIDATKYPLPEIKQATKRTRKIGLGIMGLADMLAKLKVSYDSELARRIAAQYMSKINHWAAVHSRSREHADGQDLNHRRNVVVTSIAPTGTISAIAGCSFGIEPYYALVYTKTILDGKTFSEVVPTFEEALKDRGLYSEDLINQVAHNGGSCKGLVPDDLWQTFKTAHEIDYRDHVLMQAALQEHVEQSISKTINLPESATVEDVSNAYKLAWDKGCKGVTVYRDGSRAGQVLSTKHKPAERPHKLHGETAKYKTGCGSLYVTVNKSGDDVQEVFANHSFKHGECPTVFINAIARVVSISLRAGVDPVEISRVLRGQTCWEDDGELMSCADAIGRALAPVVCNLGGECQTCG